MLVDAEESVRLESLLRGEALETLLTAQAAALGQGNALMARSGLRRVVMK